MHCWDRVQLALLLQADFLSLDMGSSDLSEVRGVILDPSCSGSGTSHSRMDHLLPSNGQGDFDQETARLQALAAFQVLATGCDTLKAEL